MSKTTKLCKNTLEKIFALENKIKSKMNTNQPISDIDAELTKLIKSKIDNLDSVITLYKGTK